MYNVCSVLEVMIETDVTSITLREGEEERVTWRVQQGILARNATIRFRVTPNGTHIHVHVYVHVYIDIIIW